VSIGLFKLVLLSILGCKIHAFLLSSLREVGLQVPHCTQKKVAPCIGRSEGFLIYQEEFVERDVVEEKLREAIDTATNSTPSSSGTAATTATVVTLFGGVELYKLFG